MQLVVFHDGALTRAFPREGPNEAAIRQLESEGVDYEAASVQVSRVLLCMLWGGAGE